MTFIDEEVLQSIPCREQKKHSNLLISFQKSALREKKRCKREGRKTCLCIEEK